MKQHTKEKKHRTWLLLAALILALVGTLTAWFLSWQNHWEKETPDWVTAALLSKNAYSRPGTALKQVNNIVIHYVGNPGTSAINNRNYFENLKTTHTTKASSHFIVGLEGEVLQLVPLDEISYCSNDRNGDTIAIEVCHPDDTGEFSAVTYQSVVRITAWLCDYFGLTSEDVIRHYDVTGKLCPLYYVEHEEAWEQLKRDVADALEQKSF